MTIISATNPPNASCQCDCISYIHRNCGDRIVPPVPLLNLEGLGGVISTDLGRAGKRTVAQEVSVTQRPHVRGPLPSIPIRCGGD